MMSTVVLVGEPTKAGETTVSWVPFTTWMEVPAGLQGEGGRVVGQLEK